MPVEFHVAQEAYQGPLYVLLDLIERRKLLINDVSLALVAEDFVTYIRTHDSFPVEEASEFVVVASALLLLKSRSLLPVLTLKEEESETISDIELRLKRLECIRAASRILAYQYGRHPSYPREQGRQSPVCFAPDRRVTSGFLYATMQAVMHALPKPAQLLPETRVRNVVSLEEVLVRLTERLAAGIELSFDEFSRTSSKDKYSVVVHFLAVLELVRRGDVHAEQHNKFSDIVLRTQHIGVPRYW